VHQRRQQPDAQGERRFSPARSRAADTAADTSGRTTSRTSSSVHGSAALTGREPSLSQRPGRLRRMEPVTDPAGGECSALGRCRQRFLPVSCPSAHRRSGQMWGRSGGSTLRTSGSPLHERGFAVSYVHLDRHTHGHGGQSAWLRGGKQHRVLTGPRGPADRSCRQRCAVVPRCGHCAAEESWRSWTADHGSYAPYGRTFPGRCPADSSCSGDPVVSCSSTCSSSGTLTLLTSLSKGTVYFVGLLMATACGTFGQAPSAGQVIIGSAGYRWLPTVQRTGYGGLRHARVRGAPSAARQRGLFPPERRGSALQQAG
jgi:hypothetical protein